MLSTEVCECAPASADLFSPAPEQNVALRRSKVYVYPVGEIGYGPLDFLISPSDEHFYSLREHKLQVTIKVTKKGGGALDDDAKVSLVNFPLQSIFSQCDLFLNEELVSISANTYHYKAYLQNMMTYSEEAKKTQLASELYAKDTSGKFDDVDGGNEGFTTRATAIAKSKLCILRGALHADFLRQDRYLLNKCSLRIRLTPCESEFALIADADDTYSLKIVNAFFEIPKVELSPRIALEHARMLKTTTAKYPIQRTELKTFSVSQGSQSVVKEALFTGTVPRRVAIAIVASDTFGGKATRNSFKFLALDITSLRLMVDAESFPTRPLSTNFTTGNYFEAYEALIDGCGLVDEDRTLGILPEDFAGGSSIYLVRISAGEPDSIATEHRRTATLRLEAKFRAALPSTVTFLILACFDSTIEIDDQRNVIKDF